MTVTEDAVTIEAQYARRANAAALAANAAMKTIAPYSSSSTETARIEAAGRIAAALILADRDGAP